MIDMKIESYMTASPHSIDPSQSITSAKERMNELGCRHLPVLSGRRIVGVISDRDLLVVGALTKDNPKDITVAEVMLEEVFKFDKGTHVSTVVSAMIKNRIGSVLITENDSLAGIFTQTDALKLLKKLTEEKA